jgi:transcriptional regulator with XRE-family HTH domain
MGYLLPRMRTEQLLEFIGANVRARRVELELTQERLAEMAGLDLRFLQRIERGSTNLGVAVLVSLATALEVHPADLFRPGKRAAPRRGRPPAIEPGPRRRARKPPRL